MRAAALPGKRKEPHTGSWRSVTLCHSGDQHTPSSPCWEWDEHLPLSSEGLHGCSLGVPGEAGAPLVQMKSPDAALSSPAWFRLSASLISCQQALSLEIT